MTNDAMEKAFNERPMHLGMEEVVAHAWLIKLQLFHIKEMERIKAEITDRSRGQK